MSETFKVMPRNPAAQGLEFQSSVYEDLGGAHNLICEVYVTSWAEKIAAALNERETQAQRIKALETAADGVLEVWDRIEAWTVHVTYADAKLVLAALRAAREGGSK